MQGERPGIAAVRPILLTRPQAAAACSLSLTTFKNLEQAGYIGPKPVHFGRAVRYVADELRQWAKAGCPSRVVWINRAAGGAA